MTSFKHYGIRSRQIINRAKVVVCRWLLCPSCRRLPVGPDGCRCDDPRRVVGSCGRRVVGSCGLRVVGSCGSGRRRCDDARRVVGSCGRRVVGSCGSGRRRCDDPRRVVCLSCLACHADAPAGASGGGWSRGGSDRSTRRM